MAAPNCRLDEGGHIAPIRHRLTTPNGPTHGDRFRGRRGRGSRTKHHLLSATCCLSKVFVAEHSDLAKSIWQTVAEVRESKTYKSMTMELFKRARQRRAREVIVR